MGKALQLLTQDVKGDFLPTMELLKRVIGAVQWDAVRKNKDTYLHLYEKFLDGVRPGTSQGHRHVLHPMKWWMRWCGLPRKRWSPSWARPRASSTRRSRRSTLPWARGRSCTRSSSTSPRTSRKPRGPGAVAGTITELASRLIGFELQLGSYAVASCEPQTSCAATRLIPQRAACGCSWPTLLGPPRARNPTQLEPRSNIGEQASSKQDQGGRPGHRGHRKPALRGQGRRYGRLDRERQRCEAGRAAGMHSS